MFRASVKMAASILMLLFGRRWRLLNWVKTSSPGKLFNMINPVNHGRTQAEIGVYKIEPYVMAGDVYSVAPHTGSGGWSWYTGSAGWMYRLALESLLGIHLEEGKQLRLTPHLPADWNNITVDYRFGETLYRIAVSRAAIGGVELDGLPLENNIILLQDDRQPHQVVVKSSYFR